MQLVNTKNITKQVLVNATLELCRSKPISKITIQEITDHCGVSRKTFYNNFKDKFDLILWAFCYFSDNTIQEYAKKEPWGVVLGRIYRFMWENGRAFGKSWGEQEFRYLIDGIDVYIQNYYKSTITELHGENALTEEIQFLNLYNSYGALNIVLDWIRGKFSMSPEALGLHMAEAMPPLLRNKIDRFIGDSHPYT